MTRKSLAGLTALGLLITGCQSRNVPPASAAPAAGHVAVPEGPVIVRLVGKHPTITVTSTPEGPRYSAQANDGRMIVSNATLEELRMEHPEIYKFVDPVVTWDAVEKDRRLPSGALLAR